MPTQKNLQLLLHPRKMPPDGSATIRRLARRQTDQDGPMSLGHHPEIPIDHIRRSEKNAEPALHAAPDFMQGVVAAHKDSGPPGLEVKGQPEAGAIAEPSRASKTPAGGFRFVGALRWACAGKRGCGLGRVEGLARERGRRGRQAHCQQSTNLTSRTNPSSGIRPRRSRLVTDGRRKTPGTAVHTCCRSLPAPAWRINPVPV